MKRTFKNPVLSGDYPDPSILRCGEDYYMTFSCAYLEPGLKILHSRDLVHWKTVAVALRPDRFEDGESHCIAAPDFVKVGGAYRIYYPEGRTNYAISAARPDGEWSAPVDMEHGLIDPGFVQDGDGAKYMYFCSGVAARMTDDGLHLTEKSRRVYDGWPYGDEYLTEGFFLESPKFFRRGAYFYIISAQGGTAGPATAHMAVIARSKSAAGPWENSPYNPLLHTDSAEEKWWCKGHGTVFEDHTGQWWVMYHAYEKGYLNRGRNTLLQKIAWTDDGWPIALGNADDPIEMSIDPQGESETLSDDFTSDRIRPMWTFLRRFDPARYALTGHSLVVKAADADVGDSNPMTTVAAARRYRVSVRVTRGEHVQAGLILQYDEGHYVGVGLEPGAIRLHKYGKPYLKIPYDGNTVSLRIVNDMNQVRCEYSEDGEKWHIIPFGMEVSGLHHNALDGYGSLRPGLFAVGKGEAEFCRFQYETIDDAAGAVWRMA